MPVQEHDVIIVGAGPAGCAAALELARRGREVTVLERATTARASAAGRTVQLSLSPRGRGVLEHLGLGEALATHGITLHQRVFHHRDGTVQASDYGDSTWFLHAIRRDTLAEVLVEGARRHPRVQVRAGHTCLHVARSTRELLVRDAEGRHTTHRAALIVGTDGSASSVRSALTRNPRVRFTKVASPHGYQEWTISADYARAHLGIAAPHIWARSRWFLVSFPDHDGQHTATFVSPRATWERLAERGALVAALAEDFAPLLPALRPSLSALVRQPLQPVSEVRCESYTDGESIVILGDAAHATAPFLGQGINIALEDAVALGRAFDVATSQGDALRRFEAERVPEGLACSDLSARAGYTLLEPPPPGAPRGSPLVRLNFHLDRYQDVARDQIPGWEPRIEVRSRAVGPSMRFRLPEALRERVHLPAGSTLTQRGQEASCLFVIEEGELTLQLDAEQRHLKAPVMVGEIGWFLGARSRSIVARTDCIASQVSYAALDAFIAREPHAGAALVRGLACLSIERALGEEEPEHGYVVLLGDPDDPMVLLEWCAAGIEALREHAIATAAMDAARLRHHLGIEARLEFEDTMSAACASIERLSLAGHLVAIVPLGVDASRRLAARLSHDAAARLRSPEAGPPAPPPSATP